MSRSSSKKSSLKGQATDPKDLDRECYQILSLIERDYQPLAKPLKIRVEKWCHHIASTACNQVELKRNRNNYAILLLSMVRNDKFIVPFNVGPTEGNELKKLPSYLIDRNLPKVKPRKQAWYKIFENLSWLYSETVSNPEERFNSEKQALVKKVNDLKRTQRELEESRGTHQELAEEIDRLTEELKREREMLHHLRIEHEQCVSPQEWRRFQEVHSICVTREQFTTVVQQLTELRQKSKEQEHTPSPPSVQITQTPRFDDRRGPTQGSAGRDKDPEHAGSSEHDEIESDFGQEVEPGQSPKQTHQARAQSVLLAKSLSQDDLAASTSGRNMGRDRDGSHVAEFQRGRREDPRLDRDRARDGRNTFSRGDVLSDPDEASANIGSRSFPPKQNLNRSRPEARSQPFDGEVDSDRYRRLEYSRSRHERYRDRDHYDSRRESERDNYSRYEPERSRESRASADRDRRASNDRALPDRTRSDSRDRRRPQAWASHDALDRETLSESSDLDRKTDRRTHKEHKDVSSFRGLPRDEELQDSRRGKEFKDRDPISPVNRSQSSLGLQSSHALGNASSLSDRSRQGVLVSPTSAARSSASTSRTPRGGAGAVGGATGQSYLPSVDLDDSFGPPLFAGFSGSSR